VREFARQDPVPNRRAPRSAREEAGVFFFQAEESMKHVLFVVPGLFLFLPQSASAGPLYGTVRVGQAPAASVNVTVACPGFGRPAQPPSEAVTDARGSFSLFVQASGRCEMRVGRGGQAGAPFEVFVSNNAIRFDVTVDGGLNRVR
jgi:hypothetical protein